jgi:hypothetical protein
MSEKRKYSKKSAYWDKFNGPLEDQIQNLQIKGTNQATVMTKQKSNFQDHKSLFLSFPNIKLV